MRVRYVDLIAGRNGDCVGMFGRRRVWRRANHATAVYRHWLRHTIGREPGRRSDGVNASDEAVISAVMKCPEFDAVAKHTRAGQLERGLLVCHNGMRMLPTVTGGYGRFLMMQRCYGVLEPRSIHAFEMVLKELSADAVMVDAGAGTGFYAVWFAVSKPAGLVYAVDVDARRLACCITNLESNTSGAECVLVRGWLDDDESWYGHEPCVTLDSLASRLEVPHIDLMRIDVAGHELPVLDGARQIIEEGIVRRLLVHTHSPELHRYAVQRLVRFGMVIRQSCLPDETMRAEGLVLSEWL